MGSIAKALDRAARDKVREVCMHPCRVDRRSSGWNSEAGTEALAIGERRYSVITADAVRAFISSVCANVDGLDDGG
jgi:hypothetical protein